MKVINNPKSIYKHNELFEKMCSFKLHGGSVMHGVNAKELQSTLKGHQQHSLMHAYIILFLLTKIAYENDEDFH